MSRAQHEYRFIRRHSNKPEVHGPYLEALISLRTARHLRSAADGLCELLCWSYALRHPRLGMVLWQIVLRSGSNLLPKSKEALLKAVTGRLRQNAKVLRKTRNTTKSDIVATSLIADFHVSGIVGLAEALSAVISSPLPSLEDESDSVIYKWALSTALAAFAPDKPYAQRWDNLFLLALFHTAPGTNPGTIIQGERHSLATPHADWDVIFVLATIQKSFSRIGPPSQSDQRINRDVGNVGLKLWQKWYEGPANRPKLISRVVAISFFRLAAIAENVTLTVAVNCHCISSGLWDIGNKDTAETTQVASLAIEYICASLRCGTDSLEHIVAQLHRSLQGPHWQSIIDRVLSNLSCRDIRSASEFYSLVRSTANLPMDTIHSLAVSLASQGFVNVALPFFREPSMSPSQIRKLLGTVLLTLAKRQHAILHPDVAQVLGDIMHSSYASSPPSPKYRMVIQHILPVLAASSFAAKAGAIFEMIHGASPTFFSSAFILRFLPVVIKHRQFSSVTRILQALTKSPLRRRGSVRKICLLGLSRGGAGAQARRVNSITWGWRNNDIMVKMAHWVHFRTNTPSSKLSLKHSSMMEKYASDGPAAQFAIRILVRAGRMLAAKRLFLLTRGILDPPMRTSLGNIILDGYARDLRVRDARHIRKVLLAYDSLIQEGELIPDRVTVNTMLKAFFRWRTLMDDVKLKILFDHMVRNGYPGGRNLRLGQVPFGTSESVQQVFPLPPLDQPISFERHSRPLLKMFIKAFHVRRDAAAAGQVIGILKSEEKAILKKRDKRRLARKAGKKWIDGSLVDH
jgi:hypothetical protein